MDRSFSCISRCAGVNDFAETPWGAEKVAETLNVDSRLFQQQCVGVGRTKRVDAGGYDYHMLNHDAFSAQANSRAHLLDGGKPLLGRRRPGVGGLRAGSASWGGASAGGRLRLNGGTGGRAVGALFRYSNHAGAGPAKASFESTIHEEAIAGGRTHAAKQTEKGGQQEKPPVKTTGPTSKRGMNRVSGPSRPCLGRRDPCKKAVREGPRTAWGGWDGDGRVRLWRSLRCLPRPWPGGGRVSRGPGHRRG